MLRGAIRSQSARTAPILSLLPRLGGESSWGGCGGQGGSTPRCTHSWGLGAPRWGARMQPRWGPGRWGAGNGEHGAGCLQHPSRELWGWCLPHPAPQSHSCSPLCSQRRRKGVDGVRCCVFSILLLIEMKNARDKGEFRKGHGHRFPFPARERVSQRHC